MLIVDASCVAEVVLAGPDAEPVRQRLERESEQASPHVVDAEVLGVIRRVQIKGELDETAGRMAVEDLRSWGATRVDHRPLLARAWALRHSVNSADALYVALAEALDAPLLTLDRRLARAHGVRCVVETP